MCERANALTEDAMKLAALQDLSQLGPERDVVIVGGLVGGVFPAARVVMSRGCHLKTIENPFFGALNSRTSYRIVQVLVLHRTDEGGRSEVSCRKGSECSGSEKTRQGRESRGDESHANPW